MINSRTGFLLVLLSLLVAFTSFIAQAADLKFPELTGRVVDGANILSGEVESRISRASKEQEEKNTHQLVVVTLPSLQSVPIEEFGYQLGRHWQIGQKGRNNGALLLVAPTERKVRIEVGYGLEGILTDAQAKRIIDETIIPRFRINDMSGGIERGANAILRVIDGEPLPPMERQFRIDWGLLFVLLIAAGLIGLSLYRRAYARKNDEYDWYDDTPYSNHTHHGGSYGGRGFGGSGFGGGGFSGGGGSFGGGGASGGW